MQDKIGSMVINEWITTFKSETIGIETAKNTNRMMNRSKTNMCCSVDQWEIERKSLLISDVKLGNGAFANVYKGTIIGQAPIVAVHKNLAIELIDNHVAVKMFEFDVHRCE